MDVRWDHKERWALKNWCFWTVVLEKTLESPLESKVIKPVNPKGNEAWVFIRRTDAEAEASILWPSNAKNLLIGKHSNVGKDWRQEEKGTTEDQMVGCHHWLNGYDFEQAPGVGDGWGSLLCMGSQRTGHELAIEQRQWLLSVESHSLNTLAAFFGVSQLYLYLYQFSSKILIITVIHM